MIKNPRMRVQDGCFLFFPFNSIDKQNPKFIELTEYISAKNKLLNEINSNSSEVNKKRKFWYGYKLVDKDYKKKILIELDENYGISKETLFVEIEHINTTKTFYDELNLKAKEKYKWVLNKWKNK